jgi:hypothetical protein
MNRRDGAGPAASFRKPVALLFAHQLLLQGLQQQREIPQGVDMVLDELLQLIHGLNAEGFSHHPRGTAALASDPFP